MKSLYYFISSLPALKWGVNPPMTVEEFLFASKPYLSSKEYSELARISLLPQSGFESSRSADRWNDMEKFLRKRLALSRAKNKGVNPEHRFPTEKGYYSDYDKVVQTAISAENPFEKEKILDLARWKALENLFALHLFDFEALIAYKLKLELLVKYVPIDKHKAKENFTEIIKNILNDKSQEF